MRNAPPQGNRENRGSDKGSAYAADTLVVEMNDSRHIEADGFAVTGALRLATAPLLRAVGDHPGVPHGMVKQMPDRARSILNE